MLKLHAGVSKKVGLPGVSSASASCETDWVERYPAHVVAKWLGHSPKVAAQHYLMSREHHFEDVVLGGCVGMPPARAAMVGQGHDKPCSAECYARSVQNAVQKAAAQKSGRPGHGWQGGRERGRKPRKKKAAGAMDGPAAVKWRG